MQARVEVNKRQILALLGREGFYGATQTGHPIQLFVRASNEEEARMNVRYRVEFSQTERAELTALLSGGKHAARKLKRTQILLAADAGTSDAAIAANVGVGESTVYRTKRRFVLGNLEAALSEEPRPGASRKLSRDIDILPSEYGYRTNKFTEAIRLHLLTKLPLGFPAVAASPPCGVNTCSRSIIALPTPMI